MGGLIASYDWKKTSLGDPDSWPPNLITTLGIMLQNKIGMCLFWGKEKINFYNDSYIPILGNKHPSALGAHVSEIWAEVFEVVDGLIKDVFQGKQVHYKNMPLMVLVDGVLKQRYYTFSYGPVLNDDGAVAGVLDVVVDTTDEMESKNTVDKNERNFRSYQEHSPIPFLSLNKDWIIDYMNPISANTVFRGAEHVIGKHFVEAFPGVENTIFMDSYKKAMAGENVNFLGHYEPNDKWYKIFAYPLNPGVGVIYEDVTESKHLQRDLQDAIEARDRFLSIASHELNTPLTSLKLHTQMMHKRIETLSPERLLKFFKETDVQLSRLGRLVDDMLDASRIRDGKLSLNFQKDNLRNIIEEAVERISPNFLYAKASIPELSVHGKDFTCELDRHRFEQVMSNLLINSFKYGEGKPVHITLAEKDDHFVVSVKDNGKGISPADQARIFDQFYRGKNPTGEGLGLGLFITRQIIQAHKGDISLESSPGKGSVFSVTLPKGH
ncbi:MAG: PAS domain-containing sensor histidine kinase [Bdellovibrionota bacterium]